MTLISCSNSEKPIKYQGYIEGKYIELATSRNGILQMLPLSPGQWVKKGQLAFQLEQQPELAELEQAKARLAEEHNILADLEKGARDTVIARLKAQKQYAEAQLTQDNKTLERYTTLFQKGGIGKAQLDKAQTNVQHAQAKLQEATANLNDAVRGARNDIILSQQARISTAKAAVIIAEWNLAKKTINIPLDGHINDIYFEENEHIQAGQPVISLLAPQNIEIIFFIPERMLGKIKVGQFININCSSCQRNYLAGISIVNSKAEYTPPVIYSEHTRDKLLYKVKAQFISNSDAINFHPGQPVDVYLIPN